MEQLRGAPRGEPYDAIIPRAIDDADAILRRKGNWGRLALGYLQLAHAALERGERDRATVYVDRMLAILREHPTFQDPNLGNTRAVSPQDVASLLSELGRRDELSALMDAWPASVKTELAIGDVDAAIKCGRLDDARRKIETQVRPLAPAAADRLVGALDGKITAPPATGAATTTNTTGPAAHDVPPERRVGSVLSSIAYAHARAGDVDTAARQLLATYADPSRPADYRAALPSHTWAWLGRAAGLAARADAANAAFERALDVLSRETMVDPATQFVEKANVVREALSIGAYDLAHDLLHTTSAPGAWARYRLAKAHRARGDAARADALVEEALAVARQPMGKGGHVMAQIAADLHAAGQVERAEQLLADAIHHIEGVDFGFSGTRAVVTAAMRMNRLDLLDRFYETYEPGEKMLLCLTATNAGLVPADADADADAEHVDGG